MSECEWGIAVALALLFGYEFGRWAAFQIVRKGYMELCDAGGDLCGHDLRKITRYRLWRRP